MSSSGQDGGDTAEASSGEPSPQLNMSLTSDEVNYLVYRYVISACIDGILHLVWSRSYLEVALPPLYKLDMWRSKTPSSPLHTSTLSISHLTPPLNSLLTSIYLSVVRTLLLTCISFPLICVTLCRLANVDTFKSLGLSTRRLPLSTKACWGRQTYATAIATFLPGRSLVFFKRGFSM